MARAVNLTGVMDRDTAAKIVQILLKYVDEKNCHSQRCIQSLISNPQPQQHPIAVVSQPATGLIRAGRW